MRSKLMFCNSYIDVAAADTLPEETGLSGGDTPPGDGYTTPAKDGGTAPGGAADPPDGDTTPGGDTLPDDGNAPSGGTTPGSDTVSGNTLPSGGGSPGTGTSVSGGHSGEDGEKEETDGNAMQEILDGLREELAGKDDSLDGLSDSLRSFMGYMLEKEELSAEKKAREKAETEAEVQAYALSATETQFPDYLEWDYPVSVEYIVAPKAVVYEMTQTESFDTPEAFRARHEQNISLCGEGGTLKKYEVHYITDCSDEYVYDYTAKPVEPEEPVPEEPAEDLTPAILEALQSIDARLEIIETDISTVSENTIAYFDDMRPYHERDNYLQSNLLVANIAVGFILVVLLGYTVAHGFWQRMKVG